MTWFHRLGRRREPESERAACAPRERKRAFPIRADIQPTNAPHGDDINPIPISPKKKIIITTLASSIRPLAMMAPMARPRP